MDRVTFKNPDGTWGIGDCEIKMIPALYRALHQLLDYEETGVSPAEIIDMKKRYIEKCEEAERYRKLSLSPTEMAKMIAILDTFKKLKHGEMAQPEDEELQPRTEPVKSEDKDYYLRMLTYARKMLVEICAGEIEKETGIAMEEHLSRMKKQTENDRNALALCKENTECQESIRPYIRMLSEKIESQICVVEEDFLEFHGRKFRNKKLLPFNGSNVEVIEYKDRILVFTLDGRFIANLDKYSFRCQ